MPKLPKRKMSSTASSSVTSLVRNSPRMQGSQVLPLPLMYDIEDYDHVCKFCGAFFWFAERNMVASTAHRPAYTQCCKSGTVILPYPPFLKFGLYI